MDEVLLDVLHDDLKEERGISRLSRDSPLQAKWACQSLCLKLTSIAFSSLLILFDNFVTEKNTAVQYWPPDGQINRVFGGNTGSTLLANPAFVCVQGSLLSHFIKDLLPLHLRLRLFLIVSTELTQTTARCSSQQQTQITINNKVTSCKQTW